MLLQKWTKLHPEEAMAYVLDIKDNSAQAAGMITVSQAWARSSPQDAFTWAKANRDAAPNAITVVVQQIAKTDLGQALQLVQGENFDGGLGNFTAGTLVNELFSQRGADGASTAVLDVANETLRNNMIFNLAMRMVSDDDPRKAISLVNSLPAEGSLDWAAANDVPLWLRMAINDAPQEAATFLVPFPPSDRSRNHALADAVALWVRKDAAAASTYMSTLPLGPESDAPRASFASNLALTDPSSAAVWAQTITNPRIRDASITLVVKTWMRTDAVSARKWMTDARLSDDVKTQIGSTFFTETRTERQRNERQNSSD
jgi:hypothetical protein